MLLSDSLPILLSVSVFLFSKFLCFIIKLRSMYKRSLLTSIPEKNESEDDAKTAKWVPKKTHEVLKAKYKCLKKLFQIYDASVIGILPESFDQIQNANHVEEPRRHSRKKRSRRTKTDACAVTTEFSSGDDASVRSEEKDSIASAVVRDLKIQRSCSTQMVSDKSVDKSESRSTVKTASVVTDREVVCGCTQTVETVQHPIPYLVVNEQRKPTRFQLFLHRLFGNRRERTKCYGMTNGHVYAASDNNIVHNGNSGDRRRRRGIRLRRQRRPKKIHSEIVLRDLNSPAILNYVQSVQKNCLMDQTARQCPIVGCRMMFYGIINYNDHLNLCHFPERKFICHYCHEGFEFEYDKCAHENEHLGITKLNLEQCKMQNISATSTLRQSQKASITQTDPELLKSDVPEEKLKKIVSFFDKIVDTEQILNELKKNRYSESNLQTLRTRKTDETDTVTDTDITSGTDRRTISYGNLRRKENKQPASYSTRSEVTSRGVCAPIHCHICGEDFDFRRQLSLHVDLEHRVHDKFSKFHSCAGLMDPRRRSGTVNTEAGKIKIQSVNNLQQIVSSSTLTQDNSSEMSPRKSDETLSCDPSTNIIYYESKDSVKKPSVIDNFVGKVRSGITSYRWEPGTKIIRV